MFLHLESSGSGMGIALQAARVLIFFVPASANLLVQQAKCWSAFTQHLL
jgi:hypothetical protein